MKIPLHKCPFDIYRPRPSISGKLTFFPHPASLRAAGAVSSVGTTFQGPVQCDCSPALSRGAEVASAMAGIASPAMAEVVFPRSFGPLL